MPSEIAALIDKPHLLIAVLFAGGVIGMAVEQFLTQVRRRAWRAKNNWRRENLPAGEKLGGGPFGQKLQPANSKRPDAADQLRVVMQAEFTIQPLLNKGEARVFKELDRMVLGRNPGWQVMAQVSLGEILRCRDSEAYSCINSKRIDLLLVDENCRPRHAVEYQGAGHHQSAAAARDAVKKEALRRAGITYHEVLAGQTKPSELERLVERLVDKPMVLQ